MKTTSKDKFSARYLLAAFIFFFASVFFLLGAGFELGRQYEKIYSKTHYDKIDSTLCHKK